MYELPDHAMVQGLVGQRLKSVTFLIYQVQFHFDDGTLVDCGSQLVLNAPGRPSACASIVEGAVYLASQVPNQLFALLELPVLSATAGENRRDLVLVFEGDTQLIIKGDSDHYECFSIYRDDDRIIV